MFPLGAAGTTEANTVTQTSIFPFVFLDISHGLPI